MGKSACYTPINTVYILYGGGSFSFDVNNIRIWLVIGKSAEFIVYFFDYNTDQKLFHHHTTGLSTICVNQYLLWGLIV